MNTVSGLNALFESATEGILVAGKDGAIVMVNPAAERMFGYERGALLGKQVETLIPGRYAGRHESHRAGFNKNPGPRAMGMGRDLFGKRRDGSEFAVEVSLSPFESENGKFVIAFIIDITVRKQHEAELEKQRTELQDYSKQVKKLNVDLERKVEERTTMLREALVQLEASKNELSDSLHKEKELGDLKSRFVSTVSHEFRTPLGAILSSSYLLEQYIAKRDFDKCDKHLRKINDSVKHMNSMLEDLLSLSKLEEGLIQAKPSPFNFNNFISELAAEMQELAKRGQVIAVENAITGEINTDKRLLKNILLNLVGNAIKFSDENSHIYIKSSLKNGTVNISVVDSGIGIPEKDQQHLFERFFRGHNATNIQGTGLGLHIISKYLELLTGKISIASEEGKGSTFTITFAV